MIAIGLNLILGVLLLCAMFVGARLERRLRALRDGQAEFAKAVSELDQAAMRTESGLAALRASSEAARTELASRIDQARLACQRLEQLTAGAEKAFEAPLALSQPLASPVRPAQASSGRGEPAPSVTPLRASSSPARGRAMFDDDLFDAGPAVERRPSLTAIVGARR